MNFCKKYFHLFLVALLSIYHAKADLIDIIGGSEALISQFPYQVSLRFNTIFICGGIIIDKRHILTAAHCVCSNDYSLCPIPAKNLTIAAGSTTLVPNRGVLIAVDKIFVHEKYIIKSVVANDIAVIRLSKDLKFNKNIQCYPLADSTPEEGTECITTGWGMTAVNGNISNNLMQVNISILGHNSCATINLNNLFYKTLCTQTGGKKPFHGDSGGALNCGGKIAGIVSAGYPSNIFPNFFTDVARYRSWINDQLTRQASTNITLNRPYFIYVLISSFFYSLFRRLLHIVTLPFIIIWEILGKIFPWVL